MLKTISECSGHVTMSVDDAPPVQWTVTYDDEEVKDIRITGNIIEYVYIEVD